MASEDPSDPMEEERVQCRQIIRLIKQLQRQVRIMETLPRSWLMGEANGVNNAAMGVLNKEIAQIRKVRRYSVIWDAEMCTYDHEQGELVQTGRRIHSEE